MGRSERRSFPPEVVAKLEAYVYRLIDPRNGETFYVGKGRGDRVFDHARARLTEDEPDTKMARIRDIQLAGHEVAHVIHRHGLDDATAHEVEAAVIDAFPGLTNVATGLGSSSRGSMHADDVVREYSAEVATFEHDAVLINVNRSATERPLYDATRFAWRLDRDRVEGVHLVFAVIQGLIVGAFIPERWLDATEANFPGLGAAPGRLGFVGKDAPQAIADYYVGKRIPDEYRKQGAANPVKYVSGA